MMSSSMIDFWTGRRQEGGRSVRLPGTVDAKGVEAKYASGVLTIRLPRTEETRKKKIDIKVVQLAIKDLGIDVDKKNPAVS